MLARGALLGGFGAVALMAVLGACGSTKGAGNGAECFVATDCQEPLVCVEQKDKSRRCTDNVDSIVGKIPPEAGLPMGDAGPSDAAPAGEAGPKEPVDASTGGDSATGGDT